MKLCVACGMKRVKKPPRQPMVAVYARCNDCGKRCLVCEESSYGIKPERKPTKEAIDYGD